MSIYNRVSGSFLIPRDYRAELIQALHNTTRIKIPIYWNCGSGTVVVKGLYYVEGFFFHILLSNDERRRLLRGT